MLDYPALSALAAVLRTGSFEAAADALGLTQSAVSQRIKSLEDRLGTTLVRRTRPATATETGLRLMRHAEDVGLLEHGLRRDLAGLLPARDTVLRVAVTADSLATFLLPAFAAVRGFLFDFVIEDQDVSAELLLRGEVAAAITLAGRAVTGCDAMPLGALPYVSFASPAFYARHFQGGVSAEALAKAPTLTFNHKDKLQIAMAERLTGRRLHLNTHYLASTQDITNAAIAGLGWAVNPRPLIAPHLDAGRLVDLAPGQTLSTPLVWQVPRQNKSTLADLTKAIRKAAQTALQGPAQRLPKG